MSGDQQPQLRGRDGGPAGEQTLARYVTTTADILAGLVQRIVEGRVRAPCREAGARWRSR